MAIISPAEQPRVTVQVPVPAPVQPPQAAPFAAAFAPQAPPQQVVQQGTQVQPNQGYYQAFAPQPQGVPIGAAPQQQPTPQPQQPQQAEEPDYFTPKKYSGPVAFIFPHQRQERPKYRPRNGADEPRQMARKKPVLFGGHLSDTEAMAAAVMANPHDEVSLGVLADYLEEQHPDSPWAPAFRAMWNGASLRDFGRMVGRAGLQTTHVGSSVDARPSADRGGGWQFAEGAPVLLFDRRLRDEQHNRPVTPHVGMHPTYHRVNDGDWRKIEGVEDRRVNSSGATVVGTRRKTTKIPVGQVAHELHQHGGFDNLMHGVAAAVGFHPAFEARRARMEAERVDGLRQQLRDQDQGGQS